MYRDEPLSYSDKYSRSYASGRQAYRGEFSNDTLLVLKPKLKVREEDIRNLAYRLWKARGAPFNEDPTQDWLKAEKLLSF